MRPNHAPQRAAGVLPAEFSCGTAGKMPAARSRRHFLKSVGAMSAGLALSPAMFAQSDSALPKKKIRLGMDNFAVRAMNWKAPALLDYAASLKLDTLFITDLKAFENHEPAHLREVKAKADDLGIGILLGSMSICPTSRTFRKDWGTAEEHLALGIRLAKALGSPVIRVVLGGGEDRRTEGGIEARIADTVKVCKTCRSQAADAGVKIAVENHAGDMQAWELVTLIEGAGKDYVGANMDSGNACWTMEDPLENLLTLAPYVLTTSLRDSMVWESENGAKVQWTAMGEGCVDLKTYFAKFAELCPNVAVNIETISGFAREISYLKPEFWSVWPKAQASDFAKFVALAKRGKPIPPHRSANPQEEQEYQKGELERSIKYCKEILGLGLK
jgi:sugar phosphate isomerase/epimerase